MDKELELLEQMFRAAIRTAGIKTVAVALHNACVHGEEFDSTDEDLERLFVHLDGFTKVAVQIGD